MNTVFVMVGACFGLAVLSVTSALPLAYITIAQDSLPWWHFTVSIIVVLLLGVRTLFGASFAPVLYFCAWMFASEFFLGLLLHDSQPAERYHLGLVFAAVSIAMTLIAALYWSRRWKRKSNFV